jgi:hypothetical protein
MSEMSNSGEPDRQERHNIWAKSKAVIAAL